MANVNNEFGKMWGFIGLAIAGVACAGVGALGILPNNLPVGIAVIVCGGVGPYIRDQTGYQTSE